MSPLFSSENRGYVFLCNPGRGCRQRHPTFCVGSNSWIKPPFLSGSLSSLAARLAPPHSHFGCSSFFLSFYRTLILLKRNFFILKKMLSFSLHLSFFFRSFSSISSLSRGGSLTHSLVFGCVGSGSLSLSVIVLTCSSLTQSLFERPAFISFASYEVASRRCCCHQRHYCSLGFCFSLLYCYSASSSE